MVPGLDPDEVPDNKASAPEEDSNDSATSNGVKSPSKLWTDELPATEHVQFFLKADWQSSPLGPLETWGPALRFATNMVFADSRGATLYWGPQRIAIYNDVFKDMATDAHPRMMSRPCSVGFPDLWVFVKPLFEEVDATCKTITIDNMEYFTKRRGYLEETYFIGQFIPIRGDSRKVEGIYNTCYESTKQVLHNRRKALIGRLASAPIVPLAELFLSMTEALETEPRDVPFALVYSVDEETRPGYCLLKLEASVGVPTGHPCAPHKAVMSDSSEGFVPLFREAKNTGANILLQRSNDSLQDRVGSLLDGLDWRGFGEPCNDISIVSLCNGAQLLGYLTFGTNPRRAYDQTTEDFVDDLGRHISARWASAISTAKALKREELLKRDLARTEQRIRYMAQFAPVGMIQLTTDGHIAWANSQWYEITSHPKDMDKQYVHSWLEVYTEPSQKVAKAHWVKLMQGEQSSCELELNRMFRPPASSQDPNEHHAWVTALGFPVIEAGKLQFIMGTVTDVSHLKWAESVQEQNALAAEKAKRQQEEFIDITSHEMRNPLSAMFQCASMISASINGLGEDSTAEELYGTLRTNAEAANTILVCAAHQRRIIDDVLILSRLESMMLSITPVAVQPREIVQQAVKMFEGELVSEAITMQVVQHPSFEDHGVDLVFCDPSRLTQIFINLLSNAIKFTRGRPKRLITATYGASLEEPDADTMSVGDSFHWSPTSNEKQDPSTGPDWGQGEPLYLHFSVQDTGPGLELGEVQHLFNRFSQANSKTHIQYGGSGLGLYISRELVGKQGGRIGIASTPGMGTTFAFYIKTKRADHDMASNKDDRDGGKAIRGPSMEAQLALGVVNKLSAGLKSTISAVPSSDHGPSRKRKISLLLTEDNIVNQRVLRKQLQNAGCEVHIANHGVEALEFLKTTSSWTTNKRGHDVGRAIVRPVDVILMDWEMPVMDGLECAKRIRFFESEGEINEHLPIIATTANARSEQIQKALEAGIDDVVTKPFLVEELMVKIRQWASKE